MSKSRIAVIVGSTRPGRFADKPAEWIAERITAHPALEGEIIDLRDHPLPFYGDADATLAPDTPNEAVRAWRERLAPFDGFILVAAEYNHAPTAVLKNALDMARAEWVRKPISFVAYGGVGGARAVEQLRMIAVELQMAPIKQAVHILWPDYMAVQQGGRLADMLHLDDNAAAMLDDLAWWAESLRAARDVPAAKAA